MSSIRTQKDKNRKKQKSMIILGIITCVCLALCLIGSLAVDKAAPKLDFTYAVASVDYSKTKPLSESDFLTGVTATDEKDGNLTDDIYISAMEYSTDGKTLTITYNVRDYNGNITSANRIYNLSGNKATIFDPEGQGKDVASKETTAPAGSDPAGESETAEPATALPIQESETEPEPQTEPLFRCR